MVPSTTADVAGGMPGAFASLGSRPTSDVTLGTHGTLHRSLGDPRRNCGPPRVRACQPVRRPGSGEPTTGPSRQLSVTRRSRSPRGGTDRAVLGDMSNWKRSVCGGLFGLMILSAGAPGAQAAVLVIHGPRDAPPSVVEEHPASRRGYVWVGGHHAYRHQHYSWTRGHYARERRGWGYEPGRWDQHEDHYDWHRGEWRPHR